MHRLLLVVAATPLVSCAADFQCTGDLEKVDSEGNLINPPSCPGDDRPATFEYITLTVLRPTCAPFMCHSGPVNYYDYRFDSLEHAQYSMTQGDGGMLVIPGSADSSLLYRVLWRKTLDQPDGTGSYRPRMPYDQPMPIADIALIRRWIDAGADGLMVPQ
jgi:hypothetical protein